MIFYHKNENIFDSNAQVIINPVALVGCMRSSIAKQFANKYPKMITEYKAACKHNLIDVGKPYYYPGTSCGERDIILFPIKKSSTVNNAFDSIVKGCEKIIESYNDINIKSIAFPKFNNANWSAIKNIIVKAFESCDNLEVHIYE